MEVKKSSWVREEMVKLEAKRKGKDSDSDKKLRRAYRGGVQSQNQSESEIPAIDFGNQLLPLRKLSEHTGIGAIALCRLVKRGLLKKQFIPGSKRVLYSALQLTNILRQYNQKF